MPTTHRHVEPRRARLAFGVAIVVLHVALLGLLVTRPAPTLRQAARATRLATVRLRPAPPREAARVPAPGLPTRSRPPERRHTAPASTASPNVPAVPRADVLVPPVVDATPPAAPASAAPALQLHDGLARRTPRAAALDDPRANTTPLPLGERFARAIGADDRVSEEWRGEGRHRVRRGSACLDVKVARDAEIDPFNQNVRPAPRLVGDCSAR